MGDQDAVAVRTLQRQVADQQVRIAELEAAKAEWALVKCPTCRGIRKPCDTCWGWRWIQRHKSWDETRALQEARDG